VVPPPVPVFEYEQSKTKPAKMAFSYRVKLKAADFTLIPAQRYIFGKL
jgi:hypothetical protein